jgi:SAM-dependent methyltransferase
MTLPRVPPEFFYQAILGRLPTSAELTALSQRSHNVSDFVMLHQFLSSAEHTRRCLEEVLAVHLALIHAARTKLVSYMLPEATSIVDLGGANGCLYDMGYRFPFRELLIVDLPSEDRCEMYRGITLEDRVLDHGKISILYTNMTDLSAIPADSADLVWMGQAIEHISEDDSLKLYREVRRVLRSGGHFCLDTPNRNLTEIHTSGWIHPEHKIEYRPEHLKRNLMDAAFVIEEELGLCEMVRTWRTKVFHYEDFLTGSGISSNVEASYVQYYRCRT